MKRTGVITAIAVGAMTLLLTGSVARAAITVQAYYHLGDTGTNYAHAFGGAGEPIEFDSSGNGYHLTNKVNTPLYSHIVPILDSQESLEADHASDRYQRQAIMTNATDNFGMEGWVYLKQYTTWRALPFGNGDTGYMTGYMLGCDSSSNWHALYPGVAALSGGPAATNVWTYLAVVRDNGTTKLFVNGVTPVNTSASVPNALTTNSATWVGGNGYFLGLVDEVRFFTFAAGQFNPTNDLLYNQMKTNAFKVLAHYRLGENDSGAPFGEGAAGADPTVDGSGNGHNLPKYYSTPTYSTDRWSPDSLHFESTNSVLFEYGDRYALYNSFIGSNVVNNFGMECWYKFLPESQLTNSSGNLYLFANGFAPGGWGIRASTSTTNMAAIYPNRAEISCGVPVRKDVWSYIAVLRHNGVTKFCLDSTTPISSGNTACPLVPQGAGSFINLGDWWATGNSTVKFKLDEVRVFRFDPDAFNPTNRLLYGTMTHPPVGSVVMLR